MSFFLFSLRRRTWSPFSSKQFFVLLAQVSSAAILFAENRYTEQFFVVFFFTEKKRKKKTKKKIFLRIFFLKLENQEQKFPGRTKIADFRKNAEDWKIGNLILFSGAREAPTIILQPWSAKLLF